MYSFPKGLCYPNFAMIVQDGLLLNTEQVYSEVTQEVLDKYAPGQHFTWDFKSKLMGRIGHEVREIF
jgi:beta-phosphoglucomutase-like phosphatase (HAD superfamily)